MYFNINNYVKVKLTDYGRQLYFQWWEDLNKKLNMRIEPKYPVEDEDGYFKDSLWSLMEVFGRHFHMGGKLPFATNIEFYDEDLQKEKPEALEAHSNFTDNLINILEIK